MMLLTRGARAEAHFFEGRLDWLLDGPSMGGLT